MRNAFWDRLGGATIGLPHPNKPHPGKIRWLAAGNVRRQWGKGGTEGMGVRGNTNQMLHQHLVVWQKKTPCEGCLWMSSASHPEASPTPSQRVCSGELCWEALIKRPWLTVYQPFLLLHWCFLVFVFFGAVVEFSCPTYLKAHWQLKHDWLRSHLQRLQAPSSTWHRVQVSLLSLGHWQPLFSAAASSWLQKQCLAAVTTKVKVSVGDLWHHIKSLTDTIYERETWAVSCDYGSGFLFMDLKCFGSCQKTKNKKNIHSFSGVVEKSSYSVCFQRVTKKLGGSEWGSNHLLGHRLADRHIALCVVCVCVFRLSLGEWCLFVATRRDGNKCNTSGMEKSKNKVKEHCPMADTKLEDKRPRQPHRAEESAWWAVGAAAKTAAYQTYIFHHFFFLGCVCVGCVPLLAVAHTLYTQANWLAGLGTVRELCYLLSLYGERVRSPSLYAYVCVCERESARESGRERDRHTQRDRVVSNYF